MANRPLTPEDQKQFDDLIQGGIQIPPQPAILLEVEKLLNSPRNNANALAKLIGQDPGLCAVVFRVVNSPFYGLSKPIDNISKALVVLGINQLVNLIKGIALRHAIGGKDAVYEKFWERSGDIAALSSVIAGKVISACNISPDQAYMAGLFHECGVPILMQRFPDYCKAFRLGEGRNWPDFREEDRRFNTDHTVVGYLVARHWNLPDFACQAIRYHHDRLHVGPYRPHSGVHPADGAAPLPQDGRPARNPVARNAGPGAGRTRPRRGRPDGIRRGRGGHLPPGKLI
jgi:Predicted signal transduction protein